MWNYDEEDKWITLEHLALIMRWFAEVDTTTPKDMMLQSIERNGQEYTLFLTCVQHGWSQKFRIEEGQVKNLGVERCWMS